MSRRKPEPKPLPERGCHNCVFWHEETEPGDDRTGSCRRFPPRSLYDSDDGLFMAWPYTPPEEWCGEQVTKLQ